MNNIVCV